MLRRQRLREPKPRPDLGRRSLSGSAIGGLNETQERLGAEGIPVQKINEAYARILKSVKERFSIDMTTLQ